MTIVKFKYIVFVFFMIALGCGSIGLYTYTPHEGIIVKVKLNKIKAISKDKVVFLLFEYTIENNAKIDYYFNPGQIKAKLNNQISKEVWYDSLASVEPKQDMLSKGVTAYELYFVFPEGDNLSKINNFEIVDFGLRTQPE